MAKTPRDVDAVDQRNDRLGVETRSIDWVPERERNGKVWHQGPLWFLGNFQYFTIAIGFIGPSMGLPLGPTIISGALGIVAGTSFMALHAAQGPVLGLPQMIQSRAQFGYRGVVMALTATLFTYVGFNVADQMLLAEGLHAAFDFNADVVAVLSTVLAVLLAVYGHDWVHRAFRWLLYLSLPAMVLLTGGVLTGHAGGQHTGLDLKFTWAAFFAQFSASAAYNITYAPYVSDYSRYLPKNSSSRALISLVFIGASTSAIWLIALGAWIAVRLGTTDGLIGLRDAGNSVVPGLGVVAAALSVLSLVATMGMNAYGGMLTVLTGVDSFHAIRPTRKARVTTILVLGIIWYALGSLLSIDAVSTVFTALTLMLYLLVPWTAANLVDFFFVRRGNYAITDLFRSAGIYGLWAWRGVTSYILGFAAEIPFMILPDLRGWHFTGFMASRLDGVDIAWIIGLAVSGLSFFLFSRSLEQEKEEVAISLSERELGIS